MHERSRQSLYLRFLCLKRAVCSGVWEFAADFRFAIPEVRENRDLATRPWFYASATCSFVRKNRVVVGGCLFFPALSKYGHSGSDPGAL